MKGIIVPFKKVDFKIAQVVSEKNYGKFVVAPLERGFGQTLGNSLRRVLLNSLPGASVFAVTIEGARHEFSALPGVIEDVTAIVLNLKKLILKIDSDDEKIKKLTINKKGEGVVLASDIELPVDVEVVNGDLVIANLSAEGSLEMELFVRNGRGYVTSENNKIERSKVGSAIGVIATDSDYSPVRTVRYAVDSARVGDDENYEQLTLEVWTNGSITPDFAVALSAQILVDHFTMFVSLEEVVREFETIVETVETVEQTPEDINIEELNLSVRAYNCLKRAGIQKVSELIAMSEDEVLKLKNLGKKSFKEIKETIAGRSLKFRGQLE